ncbi:MAG: hypothetical protein HQL61_02905 [Magnetococcales bacterium]|uniref:Antitoxin n=1 Tax=Candidatus Magnetobacterium casense TaxID=1455061 RepID=A0ABS6RVL2_9BACT|nr:hypothetical protein [Candidatus Magnetobacterium casensis]MBF0606487.1 hypothetical protein [Nitrospirota bacterium]MBV6340313.1 hypothetical protein [Candidatus Magnetobacterium casensis]
MLKIISAVKTRQEIGQIMDDVYTASDTYIVEQEGIPLVAIVPMSEYKKMQDIKKRVVEKTFKFIEKVRVSTKDIDPEVLEKEIQKAVEAVKREELEEMKKQAGLEAKPEELYMKA